MRNQLSYRTGAPPYSSMNVLDISIASTWMTVPEIDKQVYATMRYHVKICDIVDGLNPALPWMVETL